MALKSFVVIFVVILCARKSEGSKIDCRFAYNGVIITNDEANNFEFHCNTSEDVTRVNLKDFGGNRFPNEVFKNFTKLNEIRIILKNNFNVLNENFFTGEKQNKIKTLRISPAENYEPKYQEIVEFDFLSKFPELDILKIYYFNFGTIENFKFNEKLTTLWLRQNKIKKIEKNSLSNLKNLKDLDLSWNQIEILDENLLKNCLKLKTIWFAQNQIRELPRKFLWGLTELEWIDFRSNQIQSLNENLLKKSLKLKGVSFAKNQIRKLPRKFFWGLIELVEATFQSNQIEFLHADLLKDNHKLTGVDFSDNKIRKLSPHFLENLKSLSYEDFRLDSCTGNHWYLKDLTFCFKQWNDTVKSIENDDSVCGKPLQLQPLVFGGTQSSRGKYPWIAAFYHHNKFQCGSSLSKFKSSVQLMKFDATVLSLIAGTYECTVSGKHILLAAHCIHEKGTTPKDPKDCKFELGKFNLTANEPGSLVVEVSEFILHPDWNAHSYEYRGDVTLAVLKKIVEFTQFIRPICLNAQELLNFYDKTGTVVGWSATKQNRKTANDVALEVNVKIHETEECLHLDQDLKHLIFNGSFCAGNRNNIHACSGDPGGALTVKDAFSFKAVGIVTASVSDLDGYCDNTKNQIYTEIAAYHGWIMDYVFATY